LALAALAEFRLVPLEVGTILFLALSHQLAVGEADIIPEQLTQTLTARLEVRAAALVVEIPE
jgi:hypothetical protein